MKRMLAGLALPVMIAMQAASATQWPDGAKAAVVLTYDDALSSQLDHVVPVLDKAGLRGTFFLSNVKRADVTRWRAAAAEGHELANHTVFHPCAAAQFPADPRYTTEAYTPASMLTEIEQQNVLLTAIDGRDKHGFGLPCGKSLAGGVDYLPALRKAALVTYVRGAPGAVGDLAADASAMDAMHVPATDFPDGVRSAQLIAFTQKAIDGGGMAVLVFHGVGADYLRVSDADHQALIDWLLAHRGEVWVTTLQGALDWAQAHPDGKKPEAASAPLRR